MGPRTVLDTGTVMNNYGPLGSYPGIIRNTARKHSGKTTFLNLAILLATLLFVGSAPRAWATGKLTVEPGSLSFGNITVGKTETKTISLKNAGTTTVKVSGDSLVGTDYRISGISFPKTLTAGETVSFSVAFSPAKSGSVSGKLELLSNASNSTLIVSLSGEGVASGEAVVTPTSATFGDVPLGTKDTETITVKNEGVGTLAVYSITTSGKGVSISGITAPMSIAAGAEAHFTVAFLPEAAGSVSGSIAVKTSGPAGGFTISVSGTGLAASRVLTISPTSVAFGDVDLGSSATHEISLKNTGNSDIAVSSESIKGTGLSETGMGGAVTLTPGQSATLTVEFAPQSAGAVSGGVTIASNASNGTSITVPVTGTGVSTSTPASKVVTLSWKASPSSGVVGYYVYRGSTSGGPYTKLVSSPIAETSYSDSTVTAGDEYYYVVAAVTSNGTESSYSNQAAISVP